MSTQTWKVISYVALPQVIPRLLRIFGTGFSHVSFYMAAVLQIARLLPAGHPYLSYANFGRFGIHHVLWQAWKNLRFEWRNSDQVIIFFSLICAVFILFAQIFMFALAFMIPMANAGIGADFASFFVTTNFTEDLAFRFLDRVFGMGGPSPLFNSCVAQNLACAPGMNPDPAIPNNFHQGLHGLFNYYNTGLAIVAFLLILYFVIALTAETAKTGVPFGKRFNHAMAPLRLIIALALLVPITNGFSTAQLLALYAAKWGSGMATNGWNLFLAEIMGSTLLGDPDELVVTPTSPKVNSLVEFTFVGLTCKYAYELTTENDPDPDKRITIEPYILFKDGVAPGYAILNQGAYTNLNAILADVGNRSFTIRFGHYSDKYEAYDAKIKPLCGEIKIIIQDLSEPGAYYIQDRYVFGLINGLWEDVPNRMYAENMVRSRLPNIQGRDESLPDPVEPFIQDTFTFFNTEVDTYVIDAVQEQITNGNWFEDFSALGWGGAAIWYNKIAQFNGSLISSTYNLPVAVKYPLIMEEILEKKKAQNNVLKGRERFNPTLEGKEGVNNEGTASYEKALLFYEAQQIWFQTQDNYSGNFMTDAINMLMGLEGLINITNNPDIHPLALLVGIGRSLIEASVQNFGYAFVGFMGGVMSAAGQVPNTVSKNAQAFFSKIAMLGLSIGFVLFYILPFLPFLYFFVSLTNWVKTIFEAMVGLPLWALSHIRIEGDGVPGPAGMNGYYLLFEIFVNPILIVFGMLAGMTIFAAQVKVLGDIWPLVTTNLTGWDHNVVDKVDQEKTGSIRFIRGAFDRFFFTCIYTVLVYMIGLSSFKLVDAIPDRILRWMGTSVKTFSETAESMAGELVGKSYQVTQVAADNMDGVMNQMMLRNS